MKRSLSYTRCFLPDPLLWVPPAWASVPAGSSSPWTERSHPRPLRPQTGHTQWAAEARRTPSSPGGCALSTSTARRRRRWSRQRSGGEENGETRGDTEAMYPRCFCPCNTHSFFHSPVGLIHIIFLQMNTNSSPTFPQLFTSTGKEQRRKTPRARSSSPHVFTLKALGSSKARVAERRSGCLTATVLEAIVPSSLSDNRWGSEGRKWEHIIILGKVCVCTRQDELVGGVSIRGVLYKSSFVVIFDVLYLN